MSSSESLTKLRMQAKKYFFQFESTQTMGNIPYNIGSCFGNRHDTSEVQINSPRPSQVIQKTDIQGTRDTSVAQKPSKWKQLSNSKKSSPKPSRLSPANKSREPQLSKDKMASSQLPACQEFPSSINGCEVVSSDSEVHHEKDVDLNAFPLNILGPGQSWRPDMEACAVSQYINLNNQRCLSEMNSDKTMLRNTAISLPLSKEWIPFYSSYFRCPFSLDRFEPWGHNKDITGRETYPLASNIMQSTPMPDARSPSVVNEDIDSYRPLVAVSPQPLVSDVCFQHNCKHKNDCVKSIQINQHLTWMREHFRQQETDMNKDEVMNELESHGSSNVWPSTMATEPDDRFSSGQFFEGYVRADSVPDLLPNPDQLAKIEETGTYTMAVKRTHPDSNASHLQEASSPLRMSVESRIINVMKDNRFQRIFTKQRRGRQIAVSDSYAHEGQDRYPNHHEVKKSRSYDRPTLPCVQDLARDDQSVCLRDTSPAPTVRTIGGRRVTMVDTDRKVFIIDLLTAEDCDSIRKITDDYVRGVHESKSGAATWRTLYTYTKQDLPCGEVPGLTTRFTNRIMAEVIKVVGEVYGQPKEAAKLRPRSWKEPHLLLYQRIDNKPIHTGVEMHYDGCDITWNCMLSKPSEYDGGGTYIRCLRKTIQLNQGQILVHPGELYHKGIDITGGVRSLIVCFMDGFSPKITDDSHSRDDKAIFETNVRRF